MNKTIVFKPNRIFNQEGRKFLYSVEDSALFEIDDKLEQVMELSGHTAQDMLSELVMVKKMDPEEVKNMIRMIAEAGLIEDSDTEKRENKIELSAITLMVCQECNMKCAYCYGECGEYNNKGKMSLETAIKAVDYLIENSTDDKLGISFLGGEPLMNFELIKKVIEYCGEKSKETGKQFAYTITTNGTLLTKEKEEFLIANKVKLQISIDGTKKAHDSMRYFENKKPSYDVVVEKTKNLREKGLVTARATLSPANLDYVKTFEHLDELGFAGVPIAPAKNLLDEVDRKKEYIEFMKYADYFKQQVKDRNIDKVNKMTEFTKALEKIDNAGKREYGCGAFHRMYAVDIDGCLYPCHRFVGLPEFCVGSIYDEQRREVEKWLYVDERRKCSKCWLKNLCGGGCAYENYVQTGSINEASTDFCKHMNLLFKTAISAYIENNYISVG